MLKHMIYVKRHDAICRWLSNNTFQSLRTVPKYCKNEAYEAGTAMQIYDLTFHEAAKKFHASRYKNKIHIEDMKEGRRKCFAYSPAPVQHLDEVERSTQ